MKNYNQTVPEVMGSIMGNFLNHNYNRYLDDKPLDMWQINSPAINILELDKGFELHLVAPGLSKESFKLKTDNKTLTISYEHNKETENEAIKWVKRAFNLKSFTKTFTLSNLIEIQRVSAKYENGILIVELPKKEITEPVLNEIEVQ